MDRDANHWPKVLRWLWHIARLPVLLVLVILEPVIAFALSTLSLLGVLTTIFFAALQVPRFPIVTMLALSVGFAGVLVLYEGLIRFLSD